MQDFIDWFFWEKGRTGDALFSWPHLLTITTTLAIFFTLAVLLGKKFKNNQKAQTITLIVSGLFMVFLEVIKLIWVCWGSDNVWRTLVGNAPLYLCDMVIFVLPLAGFTRGRFRDWCCDFVAIWGILMAFFGTYLAGNIYPAHSAISFFGLNCTLNHAVSGFGGLFMFITGLNKMEKRNIPFVVGMLVVFMTTALVIDYVDSHNFMFFFDGGGTPFSLFDQYLSFGVKPIYQLWIYILQCGYMVGFYYVYYLIRHLIEKRKSQQEKN